jgi:hypothetical protein
VERLNHCKTVSSSICFEMRYKRDAMILQGIQGG